MLFRSIEENRYDKELVRVILSKMKEAKYYPITMIYIRFHMGNLYFTKGKMQNIETELREAKGKKHELFEVGKGEYLLIIVRTEILEVMQIQQEVERRAYEIAGHNNIGVEVKSRTITSEDTDLEQELLALRL